MSQLPSLDRTIDEVNELGWADVPAYVKAWNKRRLLFEAGLVQAHVPPYGVVADIGSGFGALSCALRAVGLSPISIDDFADAGYGEQDPRIEMQRTYQLDLRKRDIARDGLGLLPNTLDAAVTIDVIEHMHHSPRPWLQEAVAALKPGGLLVIGVPNNSNLLKRLRAVLGKTSWSQLDQWYEQPVFRSHVREPNVKDLLYIGRDLGLVDCRVIGRNWAGYLSASAAMRGLASAFDILLRCRNTLCSDLYLLGFKPKA